MSVFLLLFCVAARLFGAKVAGKKRSRFIKRRLLSGRLLEFNA